MKIIVLIIYLCPVDVSLPMMLELFLNNAFQVVAAVAVISVISPWFLVAALPLAILFVCLMSVFHTCVHQLKSLDNATRSPVLGHLAASVQGMSTIHAFRQGGHFMKKYVNKMFRHLHKLIVLKVSLNPTKLN